MTDINDGLLNIQGGQADGQGANNAGGNGNVSDPAASGAGNPDNGGAGDAKDSKNFAASWKDYIPEDLKDRSEWNNIKDVSDLYKNYISSQQMISKSVRLPDTNSTPEEIAAFYTKLGKPANKDEYDFEYTPAKAEYKLTKEAFDFGVFKDIADAANLTKDQYQRLASAYIDINNENYINYSAEQQKNAANELKKAESELRGEWGTQYQQNINAITEKVSKLYSKDTLTRMQNAGLFRDPSFLKSHLKLTKMMTGDTIFLEGKAVENVPQTLQTLIEKRDKLMNDNYSQNREQVMSLNKQIVQLKQAQSSGAQRFLG